MTTLPPNSQAPASPPPVPQSPPSAGACPLQESHWQAIDEAQARRRVLLRAANVARFSASTVLVVASLGTLCLPFGFSIEAVVIIAALWIIGLVELRGARGFRMAAPAVARDLALNQLALLALIVIYCVVQIVTFSPHDSNIIISQQDRSLLQQLPSMQAFDAQLQRLLPILVYTLYGAVIVLSLLMQGGLALYYFTRRKHLAAFGASTPEWIVRLYSRMQP